MKKTVAVIGLLALCLTGCETFKPVKEAYQSSPLTPDSFNYTIEVDPKTGYQGHYFGLGWSLK